MTLTITIPRGITGKCPPPDQEQPIVPPVNLTIPPALMSQGHSNTSIELFRQMVERTECGNIRIRKLNEFRRRRRLESVGLSDLSDSEEEDPIPCIASFMARRNNLTLIDEASIVVTEADTIKPQAINPLPEIKEERGPQLGNPEWQVIINSQTQLVKQKQVKSDYIDYSKAGPVFKLSEALMNVHELYPSAIPNALKQMAHYQVFTPLSMFTVQSFNVIHDNVRDLYMKKKTGLSAGKYVLNSDLFPNEDTLTEQTFFQPYRNWLRLLDDVLEPDVAGGWHKHHDHMINNASFSSSFATWRSHDRHLCTSFFNVPFVLDVDRRAYVKGFDCEWLACEVSSFQRDQS